MASSDPETTRAPRPGEPGARPDLRAGRPWAMEEMIALGPSLAGRIVRDPAARTLADAIRDSVARHEPITLVGSGTSEHAALIVGELLGASLPDATPGTVTGRDAFAATLDPWPGLCIAVSHEGATASTAAALGAAKARGARTAQITAVSDDIVGASADLTYLTPAIDTSWCHTIGYLSPLAAGAAIAAALAGRDVDGGGLTAHLESTLAGAREPAGEIAVSLAAAARVIPVGSGLDEHAARELALKLEEGARVPAAARETETLLHGHLAAVDGSAAAIFVVGDPRRTDVRTVRAAQAARAVATLGAPVGAILTTDAARRWGGAGTGAGRIVVADAATATGLDPLAVSALAIAVAVQVLALAVVHARGTNPDLIGRDDPVHQRAADVAKEPIPA